MSGGGGNGVFDSGGNYDEGCLIVVMTITILGDRGGG